MVIRTVLDIRPSHTDIVECVGHIHASILQLLHQDLRGQNVKPEVVLDTCCRGACYEVLAEHEVGGIR